MLTYEWSQVKTLTFEKSKFSLEQIFISSTVNVCLQIWLNDWPVSEELGQVGELGMMIGVGP